MFFCFGKRQQCDDSGDSNVDDEEMMDMSGRVKQHNDDDDSFAECHNSNDNAIENNDRNDAKDGAKAAKRNSISRRTQESLCLLRDINNQTTTDNCHDVDEEEDHVEQFCDFPPAQHCLACV